MTRLGLLLILTFPNIIFGVTYNFPPGFKFGVATASYQVEGGWNASGKGENIWDRFTHETPSKILDHSTGDIACDSYHLWKDDVEKLKYLGVDYYRFSLSWSRLLPTGLSNIINVDGVRYYNGLINYLLENNIEPMVTLYHWDLPQPLQDIGGITNPLIANYFEDYARVAFQLFGDRVKRWITFNEPHSVCLEGFEDGYNAPGIQSRGIGCYLCGKTVLLAHARAYHLYDNLFRKHQNGKIGITVDCEWYEPKTNTSEDIAAAEQAIQFNFGWWTNPIFSQFGDYPEIMKTRISALSKAQHFSETRLTPLKSEEIKFIKGTFDFLGVNHYSSKLAASTNIPVSKTPTFNEDVGVKIEIDPRWKQSAAPWLQVVPWGLRKLLNWVREKYNNPLVYITENGYADKGGTADTDRIDYHQQYLSELLKAINDGCNVQRYTIWSLMDNMEWSDGYTLKFGLYSVNFSSPRRTRIPKASVEYIKNIIKTRTLIEKSLNADLSQNSLQ